MNQPKTNEREGPSPTTPCHHALQQIGRHHPYHQQALVQYTSRSICNIALERAVQMMVILSQLGDLIAKYSSIAVMVGC